MFLFWTTNQPIQAFFWSMNTQEPSGSSTDQPSMAEAKSCCLKILLLKSFSSDAVQACATDAPEDGAEWCGWIFHKALFMILMDCMALMRQDINSSTKSYVFFC